MSLAVHMEEDEDKEDAEGAEKEKARKQWVSPLTVKSAKLGDSSLETLL